MWDDDEGSEHRFGERYAEGASGDEGAGGGDSEDGAAMNGADGAAAFCAAQGSHEHLDTMQYGARNITPSQPRSSEPARSMLAATRSALGGRWAHTPPLEDSQQLEYDRPRAEALTAAQLGSRGRGTCSAGRGVLCRGDGRGGLGGGQRGRLGGNGQTQVARPQNNAASAGVRRVHKGRKEAEENTDTYLPAVGDKVEVKMYVSEEDGWNWCHAVVTQVDPVGRRARVKVSHHLLHDGKVIIPKGAQDWTSVLRQHIFKCHLYRYFHVENILGH